ERTVWAVPFTVSRSGEGHPGRPGASATRPPDLPSRGSLLIVLILQPQKIEQSEEILYEATRSSHRYHIIYQLDRTWEQCSRRSRQRHRRRCGWRRKPPAGAPYPIEANPTQRLPPAGAPYPIEANRTQRLPRAGAPYPIEANST